MNARLDCGLHRNGLRRGEPRFVNRGGNQSQQLADFIFTRRARALAPPREQGTNGVLENFAGDAADVCAERMRGKGVPRWYRSRKRSNSLWGHGLCTLGTVGCRLRGARVHDRLGRTGADVEPATPYFLYSVYQVVGALTLLDKPP